MKKQLINIKNFIQGYSRYYYDKYIGLPQHQKEQVDYRISQCQDDCAKQGKCIHCGCKFPDRAFTVLSCNEDRFPNILNESEWEKFKKDNGILY